MTYLVRYFTNTCYKDWKAVHCLFPFSILGKDISHLKAEIYMDIYTYTDRCTYIHIYIYIYKIHNSKLFARGNTWLRRKQVILLCVEEKVDRLGEIFICLLPFWFWVNYKRVCQVIPSRNLNLDVTAELNKL